MKNPEASGRMYSVSSQPVKTAPHVSHWGLEASDPPAQKDVTDLVFELSFNVSIAPV